MKQAQTALRETTKHDCFVYNNEQRPIDVKHVKGLMESMGIFGFLPSKPIQCYQEGKKFVIIDGHHRYVAAKNLGIPVLFVVESKSHCESMSRVNGLQKTWQVKNYMDQYAKRGIESYRELSAYYDLGFPIMQAARLLSGYACVTGSNQNSATGKSVRDGTFKVKTREKIEVIANFIRDNGQNNPAFKTSNFISAFELCLRVSDFESERLTRKLSLNPKMVARTANVDQMLDQLAEVYNYHQRIQEPLAFNARQARKR